MKLKLSISRNKTIIHDFGQKPVLLLTGPTGSGKSYIELELIEQALKDKNFKLVLIDCKRVEFPAVRKQIWQSGGKFAYINEKDLLVEKGWGKLNDILDSEPNLFIAIDEYSDLICQWPKQFESFVAKIAKSKSNHFLVISTSSPRTDVVTENLKKNISRTIYLKS